MAYPSLVIQLENLSSSGKAWDADVRVLALDTKTSERSPARKKAGRGLDLNMKRPDAWREHDTRKDPAFAAYRFGNAALAGSLPEIPLQEMELPRYEVSRASEPELKKILMELEELRLRNLKRVRPELDME